MTISIQFFLPLPGCKVASATAVPERTDNIKKSTNEGAFFVGLTARVKISQMAAVLERLLRRKPPVDFRITQEEMQAWEEKRKAQMRNGWTEREVTDPRQMEMSLRYATLAIEGEGYSPEGSFLIPFHKKINSEAFQLWIRHKGGYLEDYSIDIGRLEGDEFASSGWMDFTLWPSFWKKDVLSGLLPPGEKDPQIARTYIGDNVFVAASAHRNALQYYGRHWGLFVEPELRGQHVATSLVNAARVIANQREVPILVLEGIDLSGTSESGDFYPKLGFPIRYQMKDLRGNGMLPVSVIPTASSETHPYVFK